MSKTALIIEDSEDNMELISFILIKNGYEVIKATHGVQGVELAIKHRPCFIILDIQLPDINGLEVARRIRVSKVDGTIPIIAMTSFAMLGDREELMEAGCNGYIEKPIEVGSVMQQIEEVLGKKQ